MSSIYYMGKITKIHPKDDRVKADLSLAFFLSSCLKSLYKMVGWASLISPSSFQVSSSGKVFCLFVCKWGGLDADTYRFNFPVNIRNVFKLFKC